MPLALGLFIRQDDTITERVNSTEGPSFYLKLAKKAEEVGYDSYWQPDHWLLPNNKATLDCWSIIAAIATVTSRIKLGSLVTPVVAYPPAVLAKRVITVQLISNNRVILGAGAGWYKNEFEAFGVNFRDHRVRTSMLEEAMRLFELAWGREKPVYHAGEHYSTKGLILGPLTTLPPIWLGGTSDEIMKLTAKYGDGWIPYEVGYQDFSNRINKLRAELDAEGRKISDVKVGLATRVVARRTRQQAEEVLRTTRLTRDYDTSMGQKGHLIIGGYEECAEELSAYIDAGLNYLVLSPQPTDATASLLESVKDELVTKVA